MLDGSGRGRRHRRWYRTTGMPGWMRSGEPSMYRPPLREYPQEDFSQRVPMPYPELRPEDELRMLEEEEQMLADRLEEIRERMKKLKDHVKREPGRSPRASESKQEEVLPSPRYPYASLPYSRGSSRDELRILRERERFIEFELEGLKNRIKELPEFEGDDTLRKVYNLLPKLNCGGCGYPTCLDCARAIAIGYAPADSCVIAESEILAKIEDILFKKENKKEKEVK